MQITIQGYKFEVGEPYTVGFVTTEVETSALNRLRGENIGNNMRKMVAEIIDMQPTDPDDDSSDPSKMPLSEKQLKEIQSEVSKYDASYTLEMSRGANGDPVTVLARQIARGLLEKEVKKHNFASLKAWRDAVGSEYYAKKVNEVAANSAVRDEAIRRHREEKAPKITGLSL